jgi:hypothetical protein
VALSGNIAHLSLHIASLERISGKKEIFQKERTGEHPHAAQVLQRNGKDSLKIVSIYYSEGGICPSSYHNLNFSYHGYYSRKYEHDFYARKNYLTHVEQKVRIVLL